jgi:hypothetical protein
VQKLLLVARISSIGEFKIDEVATYKSRLQFFFMSHASLFLEATLSEAFKSEAAQLLHFPQKRRND